MTPPTSLNDLRTRLHNADVTIRINTRTEIIRTRWPTTIDPTTRAELTKRLTAANQPSSPPPTATAPGAPPHPAGPTTMTPDGPSASPARARSERPSRV